MPANDELTVWQDQKDEDEGDAADIAPLESIDSQQRQGANWEEGFVRVASDGGVADPDDYRIALGGVASKPVITTLLTLPLQ